MPLGTGLGLCRPGDPDGWDLQSSPQLLRPLGGSLQDTGGPEHTAATRTLVCSEPHHQLTCASSQYACVPSRTVTRLTRVRSLALHIKTSIYEGRKRLLHAGM